MGQLDKFLGPRGVDTGDVHLELNGQSVETVLGRPEGNMRGDRRIRGIDALGFRPVEQRSLKTRGIAGSEQGLRVHRGLGCGARLGKVEFDQTVGTAYMSRATALGAGGRHVGNLGQFDRHGTPRGIRYDFIVHFALAC